MDAEYTEELELFAVLAAELGESAADAFIDDLLCAVEAQLRVNTSTP